MCINLVTFKPVALSDDHPGIFFFLLMWSAPSAIQLGPSSECLNTDQPFDLATKEHHLAAVESSNGHIKIRKTK